MPKKKINRGGLIPYVRKNDEIYMLFMKPSKAKFGGAAGGSLFNVGA